MKEYQEAIQKIEVLAVEVQRHCSTLVARRLVEASPEETNIGRHAAGWSLQYEPIGLLFNHGFRLKRACLPIGIQTYQMELDLRGDDHGLTVRTPFGSKGFFVSLVITSKEQKLLLGLPANCSVTYALTDGVYRFEEAYVGHVNIDDEARRESHIHTDTASARKHLEDIGVWLASMRDQCRETTVLLESLPDVLHPTDGAYIVGPHRLSLELFNVQGHFGLLEGHLRAVLDGGAKVKADDGPYR